MTRFMKLGVLNAVGQGVVLSPHTGAMVGSRVLTTAAKVTMSPADGQRGAKPICSKEALMVDGGTASASDQVERITGDPTVMDHSTADTGHAIG